MYKISFNRVLNPKTAYNKAYLLKTLIKFK